jgi:hypothetical protein
MPPTSRLPAEMNEGFNALSGGSSLKKASSSKPLVRRTKRRRSQGADIVPHGFGNCWPHHRGKMLVHATWVRIAGPQNGPPNVTLWLASQGLLSEPQRQALRCLPCFPPFMTTVRPEAKPCSNVLGSRTSSPGTMEVSNREPNPALHHRQLGDRTGSSETAPMILSLGTKVQKPRRL